MAAPKRGCACQQPNITVIGVHFEQRASHFDRPIKFAQS